MRFKISKMNQKEAMEIADNWKYNDEYAFYDMTADPEDYEEIVNELKRGDNYFSVIKDDSLYGFFCISEDNNNNIEVGLGMKPEYTGLGKGLEFVNLIIEYVKSNYKNKTIILDVASFNERAIKVYERAGFCKKGKKWLVQMEESMNLLYWNIYLHKVRPDILDLNI